jgi:hypothetical protein
MRKLALFSGHGGERGYLLGYPLPAAVRADDSAFIEISDVKRPSEFLVAVLAEKNVLRHGPTLLDLSSLGPL